MKIFIVQIFRSRQDEPVKLPVMTIHRNKKTVNKAFDKFREMHKEKNIRVISNGLYATVGSLNKLLNYDSISCDKMDVIE